MPSGYEWGRPRPFSEATASVTTRMFSAPPLPLSKDRKSIASNSRGSELCIGCMGACERSGASDTLPRVCNMIQLFSSWMSKRSRSALSPQCGFCPNGLETSYRLGVIFDVHCCTINFVSVCHQWRQGEVSPWQVTAGSCWAHPAVFFSSRQCPPLYKLSDLWNWRVLCLEGDRSHVWHCGWRWRMVHFYNFWPGTNYFNCWGPGMVIHSRE